MKNLKVTIRLFAVIFAATICLKTQAAAINGNIQDQAGQVIPFANVLLLNLPDSSLNTGVTSDMEGNFQLTIKEEGTFLLKISVMGFEEFYKIISVPGSLSGEDLGVISLKEKSEMLQAVEVKAQRPQFISHPDKLVMDVENTSLYDGSSAFEVLSKAPGVWVDQNGEISLNGKKGVRVLLDGRPIYVSGEELKNMLQGMSSESIKNIEIIDNPSAKYDAEGAGGIINLNFNVNSKRGLNGGVFANHQYKGEHASQFGLNLQGKKSRTTYFLNADAGNSRFMRDMEAFRTVEVNNFELRQTVEDRRNSLKPNLFAGLDYQVNDKNNIGFNYRGSGTFHEGDWDTRNKINEDGQQLYADAFNYTKTDRVNHMYNAHYTFKFEKNESKITVDANYADLNSTSKSTFTNNFTQDDNSWQEVLSTDNPSYFDIYSIQGDYETNIPAIGVKIESGAKYSFVKSSNNLDFYLHKDENKILDDIRTNHFKYSEQIKAAYFSGSKKISEKLTVKGGLRAEHTLVDGESAQVDEGVRRDFISLFPSLFVQHTWSEKYMANFSYSRRINRADYTFLNPGIKYTDPYSYIQGNPYLRSQYTHSLSFSQIFSQQVNLSLGYDLAEDFIGELPLQDAETNQTVFSIRNMDRMENVNVRLMAPIQITNFWQSNTQLIYAHQRFNTKIEGSEQQNVENMFSIRSTQTFSLPKGFKVDLFASYQGPVAYGLYQISDFWWMDLGIKKSMLKEELDISLNFSDIFRTHKFNGNSGINGNTIEISQYMYHQGIRLSLRYNFSFGDQFKANNKRVDLEEIKRAGGA